MKQIKSLIGLVVVLGAFYLAFKLMPPYYNSLQFQDAVDAETRASSRRNWTPFPASANARYTSY